MEGNKIFKYLITLLILISLNSQSAENIFTSNYLYNLEVTKNEKNTIKMFGTFDALDEHTEAAVKNLDDVVIFNLKYLTSTSITDNDSYVNFAMYLDEFNNFYADFKSTECGKASFKSNTIIKKLSLDLVSEKGCNIKITLGDLKR